MSQDFKKLDWNPDTNMPVGKGATTQRFIASDEGRSFEIDTHPWGEADLIVSGTVCAHVEKDSEQQAFQNLEAVAEDLDRKAQTGGKAATPETTDVGPLREPN